MDIVLNKKDFDKFIELLLNKYNTFGPSKIDNSETLTKIDSLDKLKLNNTNFKMSPKGFFFSQTETLFAFNPKTNETKLKEGNNGTKKNLLFGIRPCDAKAISFLDLVFKHSYPKDYYYTIKRDKTIIISFACINPGASCFCSSVGCNPDSEAGADLLFFELTDKYLIRIITEKGKEILKDAKTNLTVATQSNFEQKDRLMDSAKNKLKKIFEIKELEKRLDDFAAPYWEELHQKCLGCGICTYFCPTCHCFDITDEIMGGKKEWGKRVRTWDSCMFPLFTLHASGHNPRPTQKERMRQRIMHKFNYAAKNYGEIFCVGCGRCVIHCPVNLDIRKIIKEIGEAK